MSKEFAKRNRKGFTIVEVVMTLVVMGLMLLTIQIVMPLLNHQQSDDLAWHYALAEIEQNNEAFKITQVRRNRLKLEGRKSTKPYLLLQNKQSLILSTPEGGYVPLMDHVADISFSEVTARFVELRLVVQRGRTFTAVLSNEVANHEK